MQDWMSPLEILSEWWVDMVLSHMRTPAFADVSMERFPIITFTPMEFPIVVIAEVTLVDGSKETKSSS